MEKRYLITGVSGVDPYTNVFLVPQLVTKKQIEDGSNIDVIITHTKDEDIPKEVKLENVFLDGSMLNILRKYLNLGKPITDIYIYLTEVMKNRKNIYENTIKRLYENSNVDNLNIVFYPNDFYNDSKQRFRKDDVQKFASYYKEIYEIYSKIIKENSKSEIILNISSGTPAFKADMMIMAVTNNLKIEQTANSIEQKDLEEYIKQKDSHIYNDILERLEKVKANNSEKSKRDYENYNVKINIESKQIKYFLSDKVIEEQLKFLNETEENINSRSTEESIDEIKKIVLLESIEDSIVKKDYCGIYNNLKNNEKYLKKHGQELLSISGNLYYRYIGDDIKAKESIKNNEQEFYPILKSNSIQKCSEDIKNEINDIIEKSNIMKIKSKREEINDWLLISTPLIEAISSLFVTKKTNFNFEDILEKTNNKTVISLDKFNQIAPKELKEKLKNVVKESDNNFLNAYFYKNIIFEMVKNAKNQTEKEEIEKILDYIYIVDLARTARVSAAHSIQNISKTEFEKLYKNKLIKHSRYKRLQKITKQFIDYENNKNIDLKNNINIESTINKNIDLKENKTNQSINCVEYAINRLIIELLPDNNLDTIKCFEESINIYDTLEKKILSLLEQEIYE